MIGKLIIAIILAVLASMALDSKAQTAPLSSITDYRYSGQVLRNAKGDTLRSSRVVTAFKRQWACPATGLHTGACPGWAVDHVIPLDCGGVDAVYNMQWLPDQIKSAQGEFSKDHFERRIYGGHNLSEGCP